MKLQSLYNIFAQHPEGHWIVQPPNPMLLYEFVRTHPIKRVLDLGTGIGCSASIIALALKDKGETDWHIDTVDQFDKCINLAKKLIPQELQENITFHKAEAVMWQFDKIPHQTFSVYDRLPEGEYDFILNDGPSPWLEGESYVELPNATIMNLLIKDKIKKGCYIAWDGRLPALKLLERFFGDNFWLTRPAHKDDFNVIERKDNELHFEDEKLKQMKASTYFK